MSDSPNDLHFKTMQSTKHSENKLSTKTATNIIPRDTPKIGLLAAAPVGIQSSNKINRHIIQAFTRWKRPPNTLRQQVGISFSRNKASEQQNDTSEDSVHRPRTTIATSAVSHEQCKRPTLEKINDNPILDHRKPPDSTNFLSGIVQMNEIVKRTTSSSPKEAIPYSPAKRSKENEKKDLELERDKLQNDVKTSLNDHTDDPTDYDRAKDLNERTDWENKSCKLINSLAKRSKKKDLDRERCKLKEEFKKIYSSLHVTLEQLNTIHLKWPIHQYKRAHWLCALGGTNCENYCHAALKCQFEIITNNYQNWLDTLAAYSIIHDVTISIARVDIEDAKVLNSFQAGAATFDDQVEWIKEKAPALLALLALLKRNVRYRENGVVFREQFDKDISIHVLPCPIGPIVISPNNTSGAAITNSLPPDGNADKAKENVGSNCDAVTEPVETVILGGDKIDEALPVPDNPANKFIFLLGEAEEKKLREALTDVGHTPAATETKVKEDKVDTAQPPPLENAWYKVEHPHAIFEALSYQCELQKSTVVEKHSMRMPAQSKSLPCDKALTPGEVENAIESIKSRGDTCPDSSKSNMNDEWDEVPYRHQLQPEQELKQLMGTFSCIEEPPCPIKNSLTVCGAGNTIQWTENEQISVPSKTVSLAPLVQTSDPTDSTAPNHNQFAALAAPVQKSTVSKKSKWVVPPKSDKEVREDKKVREERKRIGQQKKLNHLASPPSSD